MSCHSAQNLPTIVLEGHKSSIHISSRPRFIQSYSVPYWQSPITRLRKLLEKHREALEVILFFQCHTQIALCPFWSSSDSSTSAPLCADICPVKQRGVPELWISTPAEAKVASAGITFGWIIGKWMDVGFLDVFGKK